MQITFKKKWFNPLYFIINDLLEKNPTINQVFIMGSKASGKTFTACQYIAIKSFIQNVDSILFRKESTRIKTTLYKSFIAAINATRMENAYIKQDFKIIGKNGIQHVFKGLDKAEKAKGIESFGYILLDELDHFTKEDYIDIKLAFRGEKVKCMFLTWNPVSEKLWIKPYLDSIEWHNTHYKLPTNQSFVKISADKTKAYIKTLYSDNYWTVGSPCGSYGYVDKKVLSDNEELKTIDYRSYLVNVLAEWGAPENKAPAYWAYKEDVNHVTEEYQIDKNNYTDISFDFNANFQPLLIGQFISQKGEWHRIELLQTNSQEASRHNISALEYVCQLFKKKYIDTGLVYPHMIRITGDATGQNNSAFIARDKTAYYKICEILGIKPSQVYIRKKNLAHTTSLEIINAAHSLLKNKLINHIPLLNEDIKSAFIDSKGSLEEAKKAYGLHILDADRYLLDFWFSYTSGFLVDYNLIYNNIKNYERKFHNHI